MALPAIPILLIAVPLVEIALFVIVGSQIGVLPTIGLTIATALIGAMLLRVQGFGVLARIRDKMERGGAPGEDLVHGLMIMLAGVLLLMPGFLTDTIGLLLFLPPVRDLGWRLVRSRIVVQTAGSRSGTWHRPRRPGGRTIDLDADDYRHEDDATDHEQPPRPGIGGDRRRS